MEVGSSRHGRRGYRFCIRDFVSCLIGDVPCIETNDSSVINLERLEHCSSSSWWFLESRFWNMEPYFTPNPIYNLKAQLASALPPHPRPLSTVPPLHSCIRLLTRTLHGMYLTQELTPATGTVPRYLNPCIRVYHTATTGIPQPFMQSSHFPLASSNVQ